MTTLGFIWRNLYRKPIRASLTFFSLVVAFSLYLLLGAVAVLFTVDETSVAGANRLVTQPKYSMIDSMPKDYVKEINALDGVENAAAAVWFGGFYQDQRNFFPTFPVDPASYFDIYKELVVDSEVVQKFADTRTGAVASEALAAQFGWKVGDMVPISSSIYPRQDGSMDWQYELVGTYVAPEDSGGPFLMHYDYFEEENGYGPGTIGWITIRISDPDRAAEISKTIDEMYKNSGDPTRTETEDEYNKGFLKQLGNIELMMTGILSAVFFTILLLTANTMSQSFRERISELGVLKTFGFTDLALSLFVMFEAVLMCVVPALIGMLLSALAIQSGVLSTISFGFVPSMNLEIVVRTFMSGIGISIGLGVLISSIPAMTTMRLSIVDALSRH